MELPLNGMVALTYGNGGAKMEKEACEDKVVKVWKTDS